MLPLAYIPFSSGAIFLFPCTDSMMCSHWLFCFSLRWLADLWAWICFCFFYCMVNFKLQVVDCICTTLVNSYWSFSSIFFLANSSIVQFLCFWQYWPPMVPTSALWTFLDVEKTCCHTIGLGLLSWKNFSLYFGHAKIFPLLSVLLSERILESYLLQCSSTDLNFVVLHLTLSCL
jgi:hypothetical protein